MSSSYNETRFLGFAVLFPMVFVGILVIASAISPWLELPAIGLCLLVLAIFLYCNPNATPMTVERNGILHSRILVRSVAVAIGLFGLSLIIAGGLAFSRAGEPPKTLLA